jgi:hypothetical protein
MKARFLSTALAAFVITGSAQAESARIWGSLGSHLGSSTAEAQVRYMAEPYAFGLQPVFGVSVAQNGLGWAGAGLAWTWRPQSTDIFVRATSMAGIHKRGSGQNLGGPIQFRTALDIGMTTASGMEFGIGAEHRSNARIYNVNPGLNSAYLFASFAIK